MTSNYARAQVLREAQNLIAQADALVQQALGACDDCYSVHCALSEIDDTLADYVDNLIEMQVTE